MVARAMRLLDAQPGERIADMFCGIGNFTLPIARSGATVLGMEGSQSLVERAIDNARHNGLEDQVSYRVAICLKSPRNRLPRWASLTKC